MKVVLELYKPKRNYADFGPSLFELIDYLDDLLDSKRFHYEFKNVDDIDVIFVYFEEEDLEEIKAVVQAINVSMLDEEYDGILIGRIYDTTDIFC